ncbi:DUF1127 domain-containing protein [Falsiroseomonas tokyonensis]|uniref:DUF1127 domain-containing protein n=1 Tax=Falsiroseomonas tokyonensis TaxID=430521 RepID=A0ABV7C4G2_9PROT|nr:DUF1127 domain-containing protein [Falsiroseomonas tokyonensis]MBU8541521.1 DUF1127 domain-containing protein [Falsiroseomonas tokyonensis]
MSGFLLSPGGGVRRKGQLTPRHAASRPVSGWLDWLAVMLRHVTTRQQLAEMDDRMLKDIGLTRREALRESGRAPWDIGPGAQ